MNQPWLCNYRSSNVIYRQNKTRQHLFYVINSAYILNSLCNNIGIAIAYTCVLFRGVSVRLYVDVKAACYVDIVSAQIRCASDVHT